MRKLAIVLLALSAIAGNAATRTHRKPHRVVRHTSVQTRRSRGKRTVVHHTSYQAAPRVQQAPTTDRYKEIQQSLAAKGYFTGEPNGEWGPECTEALRRFQADQNLKVDGKVGSLSLIALGLGPKRTVSAQAKPTEAPVDEPVTTQAGVPR